MLGMFGVGKTSLVHRYVHGLFDDSYKSTVGVHILQKTVPLSAAGKVLNLVLWDLANIEKMSHAFENYFRGSAAAIVVFDVSRPASFEMQRIHLDDFLHINSNASIFFAANKVDLLENEKTMPAALVEIAQKYDAPLVLTSAKENQGVPGLFDLIAAKLGS